MWGRREQEKVPATCNCRDKENCPMGGLEGCNVGSVVYKATVSSEGEQDGFYVGSSNEFKKRWARHTQSWRDRSLEKDTGLAEEVWRRKDLGQEPKVVFEVVREAIPYTPKVGRCALCRAEKLELVRVLGTPGCLNKRGELMGHCRHRWKHMMACVGARKGVG